MRGTVPAAAREERPVTTALMASLLLLAVALALAVLAAPARAQDSPNDWTVMVYLDGDNNLDYEGWWTMDAMAAGLDPDGAVEVVVLYDHEGVGGAEEYVITSAGPDKVADVPEPDMGSGATLEAFVTRAMTEHPADHYILDIWDHGGGWIYVCVDDTSETRMMIPAMGAALGSATSAVGDTIDIVNFEACSMQTIEVADQIAGAADFVCATEVTMDAYGPPWTSILAAIEADPAQPVADVCRTMVDTYVADKIARCDSRIVAQYSAVETAKLGALVEACDGLSRTLTAGMDAWYTAIGAAGSTARCQVWMSYMGVFWFADVWTFANAIETRIDDPQVDAWCAQVKETFAAAIYDQHPAMRRARLRGLTVNWPPNWALYEAINYFKLSYDASGLVFPDTTGWDEMLEAYYLALGKGIPDGSTLTIHHKKG
jgi:hypothetical protein